MFDAHPVGKSTHTFRDSKLSLVAREVKHAALWGMSPCAIWCETVDSTRAERGGCAASPGHSDPPSCEWSRSKISHRSSPRNVCDLYLRTAQGRNVRGLHCIGGPFRLCRYYYDTTDSAQVSMMSTVEKCHELLCKTVKIAERCILPYLCQLTKALRNGCGDRPRV